MVQQQLPCDATFKGDEEVVVQDVLFRTENILFRKEKDYSASQRQTSSFRFTRRL